MTLSNQQQADLAKVLQLRNNHVETGFMRPLQFLRKYAAPLSYSKSAVLMAPPELSISCGINDTGLGSASAAPVYPTGSTHLWDVANITTFDDSGTLRITGVTDPIGAANLSQADNAKRAISSGGAMVFDGVDDTYSVSYSLSQPFARIAVVQGDGTAGTVCDGATLNTARIYFASAAIRAYAGSTLQRTTAFTTKEIYVAVFDGASSLLKINDGAAHSGAVGAAVPNGFTMGTLGNGTTDPFGGSIFGILECNPANLAENLAWMAARHGVSI